MPFNFFKRRGAIEGNLNEESVPEPISQHPRRGSKEDQLPLVPIVDGDKLIKLQEWFEIGNELLLNGNNAEAVEYLSKAAKEFDGHGMACALLGFCFEFGLGVAHNYKEAERYYLVAAEKQSALAYARLSFLRYYGRPAVSIDRVEAEEWKAKANEAGAETVRWLRTAAVEYNIASAHYAYGVCFHDGTGVEKNLDLAFYYYKRSADLQEPRGLGVVGYCYGEGLGVPKDEDKAIYYYSLAANKGESVSMYNLGYCYEQGLGVQKNMKEAIYWYRKSASYGNCYAQNALGYIHEEGQGVERNEFLAAKYYKLSAEQGYPWAQCNYAYCVQNGLGTEKNDVLGSFWYHKAAVQGHSRNGIGTEVNEGKAFYWIEQCAKGESDVAQNTLGHLYEEGIGCKQDYAKAAYWAQTNLGILLTEGLGVEQNFEEAFKLFQLAAEQKHSRAQIRLADLLLEGKGCEQNAEEAIYWYGEAAMQGSSVAMYTLGKLHEEGIGCTADLATAIEWYERAALRGDTSASDRLVVLVANSTLLDNIISFGHAARAA
ncbi:ERAD-associated protein [Boothiomyces macroporosus]|uniref:ERAD-associated protein n=1 Tax=Boothiomyces macroporosus TaxID=261099 RepID=A0AAD5UJG5_9FUNG|nr:ERAD-associated protein [Boothiomyces macroporosus]